MPAFGVPAGQQVWPPVQVVAKPQVLFVHTATWHVPAGGAGQVAALVQQPGIGVFAH